MYINIYFTTTGKIPSKMPVPHHITKNTTRTNTVEIAELRVKDMCIKCAHTQTNNSYLKTERRTVLPTDYERS